MKETWTRLKLEAMSETVVKATVLKGEPRHCQITQVEVYLRVSGFLSGALSSWFRNVPHAPQSIVVYRDGVGDGQLQALLDHEVPQLVSYLDAQSTHR